MTDSDFNEIDSFDVVFSPDKASGTQKLTATNPGTYYWNDIVTNPSGAPTTVTLNLQIPPSVNPALPQAFCLKGATPIHVYSDVMRTNDVTSSATTSPSQPISMAGQQSLTCVSTVSVTFTIPAGGLRYVTIHLDFQPKGTTGYPANSSSTYVQNFNFHQTGTPPCDTYLTATGKDVTGVGGFALTSDGTPKGGLTAQLLANGNKVKQVDVSASDGFYYLIAPSPGTYTVKVVNAQNMVLGTSPSEALTAGLYSEVDFANMNPSDPAIDGYVVDANSRGLSGVTVNLYNVGNKLMQSAVTSKSGHYSFRFANPGTFTVTVDPPAGYKAPNPASLTLKQFQDVRQDFPLSKQ
jgi:hypothetical protein